MRNDRLHKLNRIATWLIAGMAVANVGWLIATRSTWDEIVFRGLQYVAMLLIMYLPHLLRSRFRIEVPWLLSVFIVVFCFSSLIMGDGLDPMIALWLIHVIMAENDKYIYFNKWFLCLFLVMFSLGLGACWEIIEYTYDSLMGTNTQQFMATTTSSIFTPEDEPLCGHAALRDSMQDLILDLVGALIVAVYGFIRHDKLIERYKQIAASF